MEVKQHTTLSKLVLQTLTKGERLNQLNFLEQGSWRLAAIIHDLEKRKGICISRAPLAGRAVEYYLDANELSRLRNKDNDNNRPPKH